MASEYGEKIPQHRHCHLCGKAFIGDGNFCSVECKESETNEAKAKLRKYGIFMAALMVVTFAVIFLAM